MAAETLIRQLTGDSAGRTVGDTVAAVHALVDDSVIEGHQKPYVVYKSETAPAADDAAPRRVSGSGLS